MTSPKGRSHASRPPICGLEQSVHKGDIVAHAVRMAPSHARTTSLELPCAHHASRRRRAPGAFYAGVSGSSGATELKGPN